MKGYSSSTFVFSQSHIATQKNVKEPPIKCSNSYEMTIKTGKNNNFTKEQIKYLIQALERFALPHLELTT